MLEEKRREVVVVRLFSRANTRDTLTTQKCMKREDELIFVLDDAWFIFLHLLLLATLCCFLSLRQW